MADVAIPSIGIAMTEALLVKWLKNEGDAVSAGEPVAEIETDKATMDLESPIAGHVGPHLVVPGAIVPVGAVIAEIVPEGEKPPARPSARAPAPGPAEDGVLQHEPAAAAPPNARARAPHATSPRARRLAIERGDEQETARAARFRQLIATKVSESWREIPHFAVTREVEADGALAALATLRASPAEPRPTFTDLLLRALAAALRAQRAGDGHVGLAVATPYGVLTPVVRDVLSHDAPGLARARSDAVERARAGELRPDDLNTIPASTLSNLGAFGVDQFTGVIASGQQSLLTVGRAVPRVVADGDRTLSVRTTFHATLNADHRAIDGADAGRLLVAFADAVEGMSADC
jgi:pyruvate dehydrogenase E2 component (dihydrolipoamide acetyltransferase)